MDGHATAQYASAALCFAVDRLLCAGALVIFQALAGELLGAEFTGGETLVAGVGQMVSHHHARYLSATLVGTLGGIVLACVQMSLQFP